MGLLPLSLSFTTDSLSLQSSKSIMSTTQLPSLLNRHRLVLTLLLCCCIGAQAGRWIRYGEKYEHIYWYINAKIAPTNSDTSAIKMIEVTKVGSQCKDCLTEPWFFGDHCPNNHPEASYSKGKITLALGGLGLQLPKYCEGTLIYWNGKIVFKDQILNTGYGYKDGRFTWFDDAEKGIIQEA